MRDTAVEFLPSAREKGKLRSALQSTQPPRLQWCASFLLLYLSPRFDFEASFKVTSSSLHQVEKRGTLAGRSKDTRSIMKFTVITLLALCLIAIGRAAEEEYDYEEEPAAPVTPAPARPVGRLGGLLSARGRAPVGRKPAAPSSTTPKPVEEPIQNEEDNEEVLEESQEQEEAPTTTTEASKKLRIGVRPFRSNEDLLAALKRRRAQVSSSHSRETAATQAAAEATTSKPKSTSNNRIRNGSSGEAPARTTTRGRFGSTRGSKPIQEEVEETQQEEVQVKPKPYRRG
ncbi:uncharacterized protein LOC107263828 isoform X2 [Cephus cinctus]|uniref:Uncharacterized protein LOC107263828 isoform X2 n=1 Tax=Cephus cinctus TaxID=211228 RepID=A0AAJ7BIR0_CEPCN|nr:uncharacterized protein LOC107263828 isoform X2 [Cephus cinctus]